MNYIDKNDPGISPASEATYPDDDGRSVSSRSASETTTIVDLKATSTKPVTCPRLLWYCFKGDLLGVLTCITEEDDLHETMTLINDKRQPIYGVTALYIAAQQGSLDICKLLVENGADPDAACRCSGTGESFTPAQIAQGYGHYRTWWYLKRQGEGSGGLLSIFRRK